MATGEPDYYTTVVSITGKNSKQLHFLANLAPTVDAPEDIVSVVGELAHKPDIDGNAIYQVESWLTSMDETPGGNLYAVSMDGELHYYLAKTKKWSVLDLQCPDGLNAVWAAADHEVFIVGDKGERVRVTGQKFDVVRDAAGRVLSAVHGTSPDHVIAAGDEGLIFRFDGTRWLELDPPTNYTLFSVLCRSKDETYIGGSNGILLRSDGEGWTILPCEDDITITGLAWYKDSLYAAAGEDGVYILKPEGLVKFKDEILHELRTIGNLLFGVGNALVVQYNGKDWWGGDLEL